MGNCNNSLKPRSYGLDICTSDVTCFDGNLVCTSIPNGSDLNAVLAALDNAICNISSPPNPSVNAINVAYTGDLTYSCFTLTGTNVEAIIVELANQICAEDAAINALCAEDIGLKDPCTPLSWSCFTTLPEWGGSDPATVYDGFQLLIDVICSINAKVGGGMKLNGGGSGNGTNLMLASDSATIVRSLTGKDGNGGTDWVSKGGDQTSSGTSLSVTIDDGAGGNSEFMVNGWWMEVAPTVISLTASKDIHIDISDDGTFIKTELAHGSPAPPVASTAMRLWKLVTDGTGVTSATDQRNFYPFDGTNFADNSIVTRHITDLSVTNIKLDDIVTAGSVGDASFMEISYNAKGRVTSSSASINIAALADKQILQYNSGTSKWENVNIVGTILPSGAVNQMLRFDGSNWVASSLLVNTNTYLGVNITDGLPLKTFTIGDYSTFAFQLPKPKNVAAVATGGGTLGAGTWYYVVVAIDSLGGFTVLSNEVSASTDGSTTTAVNITCDEIPLASKYRVYKGTGTGVYGEYQEMSLPSLTDTGAGWTATANPSIPNTDAYGFELTTSGVGIGSRVDAKNLLTIVNTQATRQYGFVLTQSATYDATSPIDYYGLKITNNVVNVANDNYGLWVSASGGANDNWALFANSGQIATKDDLIVSDVPSTAYGRISSLATYGAVVEKSFNGNTCLNIFNDDNVGTKTYCSVSVGSTDGATGGLYGESTSINYFSSSYVRSGTPTTGTSFYQNASVFASGADSGKMVIAVDKTDAHLHFEMGGKSKVFFEGSGSVGIGIDDTGASTVNAAAILELASTTKGLLIPRLTATAASALTPADGLIVYVTSTNGTFTSVGFWGYQGGAWAKL